MSVTNDPAIKNGRVPLLVPGQPYSRPGALSPIAQADAAPFTHCAATAVQAFRLLRLRLRELSDLTAEHTVASDLFDRLHKRLKLADASGDIIRIREAEVARDECSRYLERLERRMDRLQRMVLGKID